ncbi:carcinoembryonic antigen-related cell adhesion molecule 8-like isoform X3 [Tachysurus ichikawai]
MPGGDFFIMMLLLWTFVEPVYHEPTSFQPEAVTPAVEPLLVVYQDFIKPEDSHQSEDFGYSTIPDVLEKIQPSQSSSSKLQKT